MSTILFLAANPADQDSLFLNREARAIDKALADHRDQFKLENHASVRVSDLQEYLSRYKPTIVHFSGHGSASEIMVEDEHGRSHRVSGDALGKLFEIYRSTVQLVVLNACYSEAQAQAIAASIPCVVGMSDAISDDGAIAFSEAFYQAVADNHSVAEAFHLATVRIEMERLREQDTPKLVCPNADPAAIRFVNVGADVQDIYSAEVKRAQVLLNEILNALRDPSAHVYTESGAHVIESPAGKRRVTRDEVVLLGGVLGQIHSDHREALYLLTHFVLDERYLHWDRDYVRLKGTVHLAPLRYTDRETISAAGIIVPDVREALDYTEQKRLVILGNPGAGKTVTLERLAYDLALRAIREPYGAKIPVRLDLVKFEQTNESAAAFIENEWKHLGLSDSYGEAINRRRVCFLLDGVNEMPSEDRGARVEKWLHWLAHDLPQDNWAVFTSRFGYADALKVPQVIVQNLDRARMREYFDLRFGERADTLWDGFEKRLRAGDDRFEKLAQNPLFLSLLASRCEQNKSINVSRAQLFAGLAEDRLEHELTLGRVPNKAWLNQPKKIQDAVIDALARAAFQLRAQGKSKTFDRALLQLTLTQKNAPLSADEILQLAEQADLIQEIKAADGTRTYKFWHHLLQEYFAARELVNQFRAGKDLSASWRVRWRAWQYAPKNLAHGEPLDAPPLKGWEESVVMAAGLAGKDAARFIHAVRADKLLSGDNLPLAGRALAEALLEHADLEPLAQTLRAELLQRQRAKGAHLNARLQAGRALGELGHPELVAQDFSFEGRIVRAILPPLIPVPAGEFIFGSGPKDKDATSDEFTTERRRTLPAYEIGRYPVTNAEYAYFIQDGGYDDEKGKHWWRDAGKIWKQGKADAHDGAIEDFLKTRAIYREYGVERAAKELNWPAWRIRQWRELVSMPDDAAKRRAAQIFERPFDRPGFWEDPEKNNPAQPVVGVNWYEADAYCKWLSAVTGRAFRLAHEQEWEKAARGTDGRSYPWGNVFKRARCNSLESHILNTSPVGIFDDGISPFYGHDFSGNVWEWTNDWYKAYSGSDATSKEFGEIYRVVRGGAFGNVVRYVRCANRYWASPGDWYNNIGFRVVSPGS